jgi:predicted PurR-regulated permease PerM
MANKSPVSYLVAAAAFVVVVAGMRAAQSLLVPFLLAAFLAVVLTPPLGWLQRKRVPTPLALLIIVMSLVLLGAAVAGVVGKSITDFSGRVGEYQTTLRNQIDRAESWMEQRINEFSAIGETDESTGVEDASARTDDPTDVEAASVMERAAETKTPEDLAGPDQPRADPDAADPSARPADVDLEWLDPEWAMGLLKSMIAEIGQWLSNATIILITVIFMLLEASRLPAKLRVALGQAGAMQSHVDDIVENIRRYMVIKTRTSFLTGGLVTVLVYALGLDYYLLWGLLAFMFNYVPNIGSIIAAVPAVVLALVDQGLGMAVGTAIGYLAINSFISYVIEPRFMGEGLGLSTLVVFLSLVFWGWVLGTVGMLLSAPLTMMVKIILQDFEDTRWIAVLLSARAPDEKT